MKLSFYGAAGTVTGSKYLVEGDNFKILVDAGLFQGHRKWREMNWEPPPCDLSSLTAVLITHAHIDHTGILPRYCKFGLKCPVYLTSPTASLGRLLLPDSARLQEEEAEWRAKRGKSRHHPPLPLYTERDAQTALTLFKEVQFNTAFEVAPGVRATWRRMGHILGAASIELEHGGKRITFSGDIGRYDVPILIDPQPVEFGNLLLIESTYGDRLHDRNDPKDLLAKVVKRTAARGGVVVIPAFAVGRCQLLLHYFKELKMAGKIPDIPVIIDSPMASDATSIYEAFPNEWDASMSRLGGHGKTPFSFSKIYFISDRSESIKLNSIHEPMVIISASGMLSGGRILHHLKHRIASPDNTILFVGFQPEGSRGAWIKSGAKTMKLLGDEIPINAEIDEISSLSAHADKNEMLRWCRECSGRPDNVAVVHGERPAAENFAETLKAELGWSCRVPSYGDTITV
ncbi:MAG: MBL fold metallo-hydrolase [Deltaproteobacteria bacterium]|nr:MBL fold metallo-hydrolase [Deltaproteobacteria bacterium]